MAHGVDTYKDDPPAIFISKLPNKISLDNKKYSWKGEVLPYYFQMFLLLVLVHTDTGD